MRIGIRGAISGLVLASIIVSAVGVHVLWWRTAQAVSEKLASTINEQIVSAVGDELQSITTEARSAYIAVRTLLVEGVVEPRDAAKRKFVFLSQLQAQPTISWVAFGWPDASFSAVHKLGDVNVETVEIAAGEGKLRIEEYELNGGDAELKGSRSEASTYNATEQAWYQEAVKLDAPIWKAFSTHPLGERPAVAFAGPIDIAQKPEGVLAIIIELTRVSRFLSQLTVGKSAGAFILDRDGSAIASPDADADEAHALKTDHPLFQIAATAARQVEGSYEWEKSEPLRTRVLQHDKAYEAVLTPISFPGWSLVT